MIGSATPEQVQEHLRAATIFCMPANVEPAGAYVEAAAWGLPVVTTDVGGMPDRVIAGGTGFLVAPGDPDAVAQRLIELSQDRALRERLGEAGRRLALTEFSWDRVGEKIAAHLQRLAPEVFQTAAP